ncbi:MAG: Fe-S cluster assembly protein SufD [Acidobacteria bacterium]|nr:Fe-S cluster assembly protein SufD [Acidobacteriota bacterium]
MIELVKTENIPFFSHLSEFEKGVAGKGPAWLQRMRNSARLQFAKLGFPTLQDEEWRFTNVAPITSIPFKLEAYELDGLKREIIDGLRFADLQCERLVFVNGCYSPELSFVEESRDGIRISSLSRVLQQDAAAVEPYLGRYANWEQDAFNALNTALMQDGAFVYIPKGKILEKPIHLLFLAATRGTAIASYPRTLIVADSNSQASVVESYVGLGEEVNFTCPVTEIILNDGAVIDHSKLECESARAFHVATLQYHQERSSSLGSHSIALGGALVRNSLNAVLAGDGAECTLDGLYLVRGEQHVDNHTRLEHAAPHCSSRELYKGVLDGKSRGVFHGRIVVHRGAQKTDSKQTNKNLLLSDDALINTKPQLEIYANDVKCTHGATIGQLDKDALFYLRSRGIGEEAARSLLIYAFASEVVRRMKVGAVQRRLDEFLLGWLPGGEFVKEAVQV